MYNRDMDIVLNIAGIHFGIHSCRWTRETIPANFIPFVVSGSAVSAPDTLLYVDDNKKEDISLSGLQPLSVSFNDLGMASLYDCREYWIVAIVPVPGEYPRIMRMSKDFRQANLAISNQDPFYDFVLNSMTRILFSQYVATKGCLMLHASVVEQGGKGFLFMGESGTGKSTHSRLWTEAIDGCRLLNDDCPLIVKADDGKFYVSGTPWSGKTPCYRNCLCKVGGIAKLRQSPVNRFSLLTGVAAFTWFIPGMSVMTSDAELYYMAGSTALELLDSVPFGIMECRPDGDAAKICRSSLLINEINEK